MLITPPAARLMVLVPAGDLPVVELAQRIWALATDAGSAVLLVGLADSPEREPEARRNLAVLQSHTQYETVPVSTRIAHGGDWLAAVRLLKRPGDCVVCFADQQVPAGLWGYQPLAHALQKQLQVPAVVLTDVWGLDAPRPYSRWAEAAGWALCLAVIAAFFALQAWLTTAVPGGAGSVLLALSVVAEFSLLALTQRRLMRK